MDIQELDELIRGRRSIRRWKRKEISDDTLKMVVELGTWAPNGGNYQGWHFIVIKNQHVIEKIADAVQRVNNKIASYPESVAFNREEIERYRHNASQWRTAPVLIGAFTRRYQSEIDKILSRRESFDDEARKALEFRGSAPTSIQSVAAAVTIMLLVFHQMGLGALWVGGAVIAKNEIEMILKVSEELNLVCLIAVGYPDEYPQKNRKPIKEVLEFIY